MPEAISRMRIEVPEEVLEDLRRRLAATELGVGGGSGPPGP